MRICINFLNTKFFIMFPILKRKKLQSIFETKKENFAIHKLPYDEFLNLTKINQRAA